MAGTVTKIDGATVLITDRQGFQRTIRTSSSTKYSRGGEPADSSQLKVGSKIVATGTVDKNKTDLDASTVTIRLPSLAGTVTSLSGSSFQLKARDGTTHTVSTTSSTVFHQGRNQASLSAVTQGSFVLAEGDLQSNGDLTATSVVVAPAGKAGPRFFGPRRGVPGGGGAGPSGSTQSPGPAPGGTEQGVISAA
jgi:Domain of unknown function (DUF5666)